MTAEIKVGDKVKITDNNCYVLSCIGDIATVTEITKGGAILSVGDMLPKHVFRGNSYHLYFGEGCFELVKDPITCEPETIYPWSGGACPVHPNTKVKFWERFYGESIVNRCAKTLRWDHRGLGSDIVAFQVVKEYVEPSEVFLNEYKDGFGNNFLTAEDAKKHAVSGAIRVAVKFREVRD